MWQKAVARDNMRIPSQFPNILAGCLWHFYFRFLSIEDFCPSSSLKSQKLSQKTKKTEHFGSSLLGYWRWNAWCQRANSIVTVVYRHLFWRPSHCHIPRKIERKKGANYFHSNFYCYSLVTLASCTFHNNHFHAMLACLQRNLRGNSRESSDTSLARSSKRLLVG